MMFFFLSLLSLWLHVRVVHTCTFIHVQNTVSGTCHLFISMDLAIVVVKSGVGVAEGRWLWPAVPPCLAVPWLLATA